LEITDHLDRNSILSDAQHGFRKGRSCETQLILTVDDLAAEVDKGVQTDMILLALSKAFDKVREVISALTKLDYNGVRGMTKRWIFSFLSDRTKQVVVEGKSSSIG
jgi:hypothetical protein